MRLWGFLIVSGMLAGCGTTGDSSSVAAEGVTIGCAGYPKADANGVTICELRQYPNLPATGTASIDTANGEIIASGGGGLFSGIDLDAYIYAHGATEDEARTVASQIVVHTQDNDFYATGPESAAPVSGCAVELQGNCIGSTTNNSSWWVSFAAGMPSQTNLTAHTANGSLQVEGISGTGDFSADNGEIAIGSPGGNVTVTSGNGPMTIDLAGSSWNGQGLSATSSNGPMTFLVPSSYSAQFELATTTGSIQSDFSGTTVDGPNARDSETLGRGGATLSGTTQTGNIYLRRK
jgi:hypothetical protein